jgi:FMN-dependent NADH-azoreductase
MSKILVIASSALAETSISNQLIRDGLVALRTGYPAALFSMRDLGSMPVPHLTADAAAALVTGKTENASQAAALALSDELIGELTAADTIVIGAPMYNFGIPSTLKAWFDHVLRAGITFRYTENGPVGLLQGKRAIVVETRGGHYSEGPGQAMDAQEPHLRAMLGFIGIADVTFVRAEKLGLGPQAREQSIGAARAQLSDVILDQYRRAA